VLTSPDVTDGGSFDKNGLTLPLPPKDTNHLSERPLISVSDRRALERLVSRTVPQDELLTVIETIVSNIKAANIVKELKGNDAQTLADIMDEVCYYIIPSLKNLLVELRSDLLFLVVRR